MEIQPSPPPPQSPQEVWNIERVHQALENIAQKHGIHSGKIKGGENFSVLQSNSWPRALLCVILESLDETISYSLHDISKLLGRMSLYGATLSPDGVNQGIKKEKDTKKYAAALRENWPRRMLAEKDEVLALAREVVPSILALTKED